MTDQSDEKRYEQEDLMANGPVSRGASNKSAPMNKNNPGPSTTKNRSKNQKQSKDYNKMIQTERSGSQVGSGMGTDQTSGTPGGGTLPTERESGSSTGGILTTNSTVGAGGSSGGTVAGAGSTRDRGKATNTDLNQTTNTAEELENNTNSDEVKVHKHVE
jgi:hypothetical protein